MKTAVVLGAGGFIGHHLVKRLKDEGYEVRGVDKKYPEFEKSAADQFIIMDLREDKNVRAIMGCDEVYQLAADMGGAGFVFTGDHDFEIMNNSAQINLNVARYAYRAGKVFYSSSACVYPERNQMTEATPVTNEDSAYPVQPDSEYGWEKIFSERMYLAAVKNNVANMRIARFHNIYGPLGTWCGGREKSPAAMCRKVAEAKDGGSIDIWGDGYQTRSFCYIDDCIEGVRRLMESKETRPVNIGSEEMISINGLASMAIHISGKDLSINHIGGPLGVRGRSSDNRRIRESLGWEPSIRLSVGMEKTYRWIEEQVKCQ